MSVRGRFLSGRCCFLGVFISVFLWWFSGIFSPLLSLVADDILLSDLVSAFLWEEDFRCDFSRLVLYLLSLARVRVRVRVSVELDLSLRFLECLRVSAELDLSLLRLLY